MLARYRCSLLAEETDWRLRSTGPHNAFSVVAGPESFPRRHRAAARACLFESALAEYGRDDDHTN
jgi:hypothetical protein